MFKSVCLCDCVWVCESKKLDEGIRSPGAGVAGVCELPSIGAGK